MPRRHPTFHPTKALLIAFAVLLAVLAAAPATAQSEPGQADRDQLAELAAEQAAEARTARIEAEARAADLGLPVRQELDDGRVVELLRFVGDQPIYYVTHNANAADTVSTDEVHPGGSLGLALDGAGQTLGIWDSGNVRATHQELAGRVNNLQAASLSNHSTHVGGTMIAAGVSAAAQGMAFAGALRAYDFNSDTAEMTAEQALANPIRISNHSYGFISGWIFNFCGNGRWVWFGDPSISTVEDPIFGYYIQDAADWDQLAVDSPEYLMVKSAGNDRGEGPSGTVSHHHIGTGCGPLFADSHPVDGGATGFDTIGGGPGSAKNDLTVGAVNDVIGGYSGPSSVVLASFTGWGPTDDGRIKPDLVANGISLTSPIANTDTAYGIASGTSMSTPNTSGSIALLNQHAENLFGTGFAFLSATMKALVLHTADEAGPAPGPDYMHGWGLLNTATAATVMTEHTGLVNTFHIHEDTLADGDVLELEVESDGTGPLRATLVWTDPAGTPPPFVVDPPDLMLVNDLDLRIEGPGGVAAPWVLDPANPANPATTGDNVRDNVEQVVIDAPAAGTYTVRISHKGSLSGGAQDFGLIVTGNLDPVCGNGVAEAGEQCDGSDLGGESCVSQGFDGGALSCTNSCTFDTSACVTCQGGSTSGSWNLPDATNLGEVRGHLYDTTGPTALYRIYGSLLQTGPKGGLLTGFLYDGSVPNPFYVDGGWGFDNSTFPPSSGRFGSKIFEYGTGDSVGVFEGTFSDNPSFSVVGTFNGVWEICQ